jgi:hypothetical protein
LLEGSDNTSERSIARVDGAYRLMAFSDVPQNPGCIRRIVSINSAVLPRLAFCLFCNGFADNHVGSAALLTRGNQQSGKYVASTASCVWLSTSPARIDRLSGAACRSEGPHDRSAKWHTKFGAVAYQWHEPALGAASSISILQKALIAIG